MQPQSTVYTHDPSCCQHSAGSAASLNGLAAAAMDGPRAPSRLQSARNSLAMDDDGSRCVAVCNAAKPTVKSLKCLTSLCVAGLSSCTLDLWAIRFLEALFAMAPGSPHADSDGAPWPHEQDTSGM